MGATLAGLSTGASTTGTAAGPVVGGAATNALAGAGGPASIVGNAANIAGQAVNTVLGTVAAPFYYGGEALGGLFGGSGEAGAAAGGAAGGEAGGAAAPTATTAPGAMSLPGGGGMTSAEAPGAMSLPGGGGMTSAEAPGALAMPSFTTGSGVEPSLPWYSQAAQAGLFGSTAKELTKEGSTSAAPMLKAIGTDVGTSLGAYKGLRDLLKQGSANTPPFRSQVPQAQPISFAMRSRIPSPQERLAAVRQQIGRF